MLQLLLILLLSTNAFAETKTTEDVTEKDAGATHECARTGGSCGYDPRTDIWSDGGSDDDIVYWDSHGKKFNITNDISTFMTEAQMLQGFTMDSSIGLRDRNYVGGDAFTVQIKVTDGTTTYSDTQNFTTSAGQSYETITSQLIVPENTLAYSLATFGLILEGTSLTGGYRGPQTNNIGLTATYELINNTVQDTVLDLVANAVNDILDTSIMDNTMDNTMDTTMQVNVSSPSGVTNINIPVSVSAGVVTMSVPTVTGKIEKIQINTGMASSSSQPEQVAEVKTAVAEVESAVEEQESESESEEKEDSKETKVAKSKAVQVIVTRVLQAVQMAGGDTDGTKLALMGIMGNAGFSSYQEAFVPDVAFYDTSVEYVSPSYEDPLGSIFNLGSDRSMDDMINSQY